MLDPKGQVLHVAGPLRLAEKPASYPLRPVSVAVNEALNAPPIMTGPSPVPSVTLTKATLVYATVRTGTFGYSEPAYLFTGTFTLNGQPLEKRILVPALTTTGASP